MGRLPTRKAPNHACLAMRRTPTSTPSTVRMPFLRPMWALQTRPSRKTGVTIVPHARGKTVLNRHDLVLVLVLVLSPSVPSLQGLPVSIGPRPILPTQASHNQTRTSGNPSRELSQTLRAKILNLYARFVLRLSFRALSSCSCPARTRSMISASGNGSQDPHIRNVRSVSPTYPLPWQCQTPTENFPVNTLCSKIAFDLHGLKSWHQRVQAIDEANSGVCWME